MICHFALGYHHPLALTWHNTINGLKGMFFVWRAQSVLFGRGLHSRADVVFCFATAGHSMHSAALSSFHRLPTTPSPGQSAVLRGGLAGLACSYFAQRTLATHKLRMSNCPLQRSLHTNHIGETHLISSGFLSLEDLDPATHLHLVVLNYVLPQQTARLWHRATTRICADGGANRLYDQIPDMVSGTDAQTARQQHLPDLIKGDMDSVRPEVRQFYTDRGVPLIDLSSDQDTTDLEKCLLFLDGRVRALSQQQATVAQQQARRTPVLVKPLPRGYSTATAAVGNKQPHGNGLVKSSICSSSSTESFQAMMEVDCSTPNSAAAAPAVTHSEAGSVHSSSMHSSQSEQQVYGEILLMVDATATAQPQQQQLQGSRQPPWQRSSSTAGVPRSNGTNGRGSSTVAGALQSNSSRPQGDHLVLVLGALGGRLDHTLANLNTLYCYPHLNIVLWGDGNLVRLLKAGRSIIKPSKLEGPTCGLVPLAQPATASSQGLKWDMDNYYMCFRGQLSTSNVIASDTIDVTTDEDLLWITAIGDA